MQTHAVDGERILIIVQTLAFCLPLLVNEAAFQRVGMRLVRRQYRLLNNQRKAHKGVCLAHTQQQMAFIHTLGLHLWHAED